MKDVLKPIIDAAKNDDMHRVIELAEKQLDKFCDNNCVWTDHHPDCIRAEPKREQGAEKQEPVAWIDDDGEFQWIKKIDNPEHTALYTPPQPKPSPLTDEQIEKCYETTGHYQTLRPQDRFAVLALARAIEAAHGIKGEA